MIVLTPDAFMRLVHSADRAAQAHPELKSLKMRQRREFLCQALFGLSFEQARQRAKRAPLPVKWHTQESPAHRISQHYRHSLMKGISKACEAAGLSAVPRSNWHIEFIGETLGALVLELEPWLFAHHALAKHLDEPEHFTTYPVQTSDEGELFQIQFAHAFDRRAFFPCSSTLGFAVGATLRQTHGFDRDTAQILRLALSKPFRYTELNAFQRQPQTYDSGYIKHYLLWLGYCAVAMFQPGTYEFYLNAVAEELAIDSAPVDDTEDWPEMGLYGIATRLGWDLEKRIDWAVTTANEQIGLDCDWDTLSGVYLEAVHSVMAEHNLTPLQAVEKMLGAEAYQKDLLDKAQQALR